MNIHKGTIEQYLVVAGEGRSINVVFMRNTMQAVQKAMSKNTFDHALRSEQAPRRPFFAWFRRLPRTAAITLLVALLTAVSGTAYAAYALWISPKAEVNSVTKQYGRSQALVSLKNCYTKNGKIHVEITNGSGGNPSEAAAALEAQCEIQAIQNWATQSFHSQPSYVNFAFTITKVRGNTLSIQDYSTGKSQGITLARDIPIAYQGEIVRVSALKQGDAVALLMSPHGKSLLAVVKLSHPASLYASSRVQNTYHERGACVGNGEDSCISLPNLDVLRGGEGRANSSTAGNGYEIQGKLVSATPTEFSLQSTSGKLYVVHTDSDVISAFNSGNPYGPITIELGDVLMVMYSQPAGSNPLDVQFTQYHEIQLMMQQFDKSKAARTVDNSVKYHY